VTGEEILRGLAEDCKRNVARASPEHRESAIFNARPFLTGAFIALAKAKAFADPRSGDFLEELLAPIEQPLVDQGLVERVSFGFDVHRTAGRIAPEEETER
jgi:hypothetical protein